MVPFLKSTCPHHCITLLTFAHGLTYQLVECSGSCITAVDTTHWHCRWDHIKIFQSYLLFFALYYYVLENISKYALCVSIFFQNRSRTNGITVFPFQTLITWVQNRQTYWQNSMAPAVSPNTRDPNKSGPCCISRSDFVYPTPGVNMSRLCL